MANTKISEMEEATSISENDILPIVKDGSNKKASIKTVFKTVQGFLVPDSIPIGMVVEFPSDNIPDNWLLCNGQAVSRTDYAELFAAIGTTWGAGDGSTTFNVPTKEGLVTVGKKASDSDFNALGKTGGLKTQEHDLNTASAAASITLNTGGSIDYGETQVPENIAKTYTVATGGSGTNKPTSNKYGAKLYGKTSSESNLQPYTTSNFIIKAKQSSGVVATVVDNLESDSAINALSANQGKVLKEKIDLKGNYMRLKPKETTTTITQAEYSIVPLGEIEEQNVKNDSLMFDSANNGIKIGAGVHHVEISGEINWGSVISEGLKATNYVKNGTIIYYTQFVMNTKYTALPGLPLIFAVEENDLIQLEVYAQANDRLNKAGTRLQVKVID